MAAHYTGELTTPSFFIGFLEYLQQSLFSLQAYASQCLWRFFFLFFWQFGMMAKFVYFYICKVLKSICFPLYIIIGTKASLQPAPHCLALEYSLLESFHFKLSDIKLYLPPCWLFPINWLHCAHREILIFGSTLTKQRICLASKRNRLNFHFKNLIEKSHTNTIDQHSCRNQPSSD